MDQAGSHLQELQPDLRCVASQTEDTLTLEQLAACEYKIMLQNAVCVVKAMFEMEIITRILITWMQSMEWKSQSVVWDRYVIIVIHDPNQIRLCDSVLSSYSLMELQ